MATNKKTKTKKSIRKIAPPKKLMSKLQKHKHSKEKECEQVDKPLAGAQYLFVFPLILVKRLILTYQINGGQDFKKDRILKNPIS